jgi:glyoxylase-like metal-dependent hydrolase (beta-lactamase superfamily II)
MKTVTVTTNAVQLMRYGLVNTYLVRETDGLTLVDTGLSGSADDFIGAARSYGGTIRRILLTHAHMDHVGSVDALVAKLGSVNVQLIASTRSLPLLRKTPDKSLRPNEAQGKIKGGLPGIASSPTKLIEEGDRIGSLLAISTPGHIPGHLSFLDERDGTLYAGDALVGVRQLSISGFAPWYFPLPNVATWDKATAVASAKKLLGYPVERFACGHGAIRDGGRATLQTAVTEAVSAA